VFFTGLIKTYFYILFNQYNMAMIKCPECGHKVSDKAFKCSKCSYPLRKREPSTVQTVEQTSKKLKKEMLIGVGILLLGTLIMYYSLAQKETSVIGVSITLVGLVLVVWNKIEIWWKHK
jgi:ribosomal protein L37E